jgi:hypothetical protein
VLPKSPIRFRQTLSAFHRVHNKALSVVAMGIRDKDYFPVGINR